MEVWHAAILGLVEGLTEYLPVSSTGHLIITSSLLGLDESEQTRSAVNAFNIVVQGGAILAVLGLYRARIAQMIRGLLGRDDAGRRLAIALIVAFLPAAILGPLLDDKIEAVLFRPVPVMIALALGGIALLLLTPWQKKHFGTGGDATGTEGDDNGDGARTYLAIESVTLVHALIIGMMQCVAMWPGTSRSMMTIIGGMLIGLRPKQAAEFSFLLGLPTLGGACVYKLAKDLRAEESMFELLGTTPIIVGIVVATISAAIAIKWFVGFLGSHGMGIFGWYRIALAGALAALWLTGVVTFGPQA